MLLQAGIFGRLMMPDSEVVCAPSAPSWADSPLNIALLLFILATLFIFAEAILESVKSSVSALHNWRINLQIDRNVKLLRRRNAAIVTLSGALALYLSTTGLLDWRFMPEGLEEMKTPAAVALTGGYFLLKRIVASLMTAWCPKPDAVRSEHSASLNYLILVFALVVTLGPAGILFKLPSDLVRAVIIVLCTALSAVCASREYQILRNYCTGLLSFLYLCALELIPLAGLVSGIILF